MSLVCVFCAIVAEKRYADEYQSKAIVRFKPLNPVTPGHMLFVPKKHTHDASEHPWLAGQAFQAASAYGFVQDEPFNLITSAGRAATQSIWHLHVHYVPRQWNDGLTLPWTGQVRA